VHRAFDIIHLTQSPFPDDPRPRREAILAAETGAHVAVIALREGSDTRPVSRYGSIVVVRLRGSKRRGSLTRYLVEYGTFLARAHTLFRRDRRFRQARVVHVHSLPDFLVAAALPARRRGARVLLDLHEIMPEFARAKFPGFVGRLIGRIALLVERWSRNRADVVLTVNRAVADILTNRPAHTGERLLIVHNAPDRRDFGLPHLTDGSLTGPVRLVYHGTLTALYGLDIAIEAVSLAHQRGLTVSLDIYGGGPEAQRLAAQIRRQQIHDSVRLCGSIPHQLLRSELLKYQAGFVPTRLNSMTQYSLSTKLLEYIHLGIPVIAPRLPTYLQYFPESTLWYYEPNSAVSAANALAKFTAAPAEERVRRAREAQIALQTVDSDLESRQLTAIYRELLSDAWESGGA
jgi:glycosyltransferase involved in cell wall biosynthesis